MARVNAKHLPKITREVKPPTGEAPAKGLTVKNLLDTIEALKSVVVLQAVWVVDRPDYLNMILQNVRPTLPPPYSAWPIFNVPIYEFRMAALHPDQEMIAAPDENLLKLRLNHHGKRVWPHWCRTPGVYLEMSDGSVKVLEGSTNT